MPIDYKKYPKNWLSEIRPRILARANNCCEFCGIANGLLGYRNKQGSFITWETIDNELNNSGYDYFENELKHLVCKKTGQVKRATKIVLTIAHLDHDKENHEVTDDRLAALCQKCHLQYDLSRHITKRKYGKNYFELPKLF